ncbi:MAG: sensor domain-containing diguanylate cyclase, partial [Actinomycetota bacterium]|nr:sensor domain-containing diguanylate cyclase [Actinomycetota bacterium]
MTQGAATTRRSDLVSLAPRLGYLQLLRAGIVAVAVTASALAPGVVGASARELGPVSFAYALIVGAAEILRRGGRRSLLIVSWVLLVDGLYLAWALYLSGGPVSPLKFLVYIHIVAVCLVVSYRTGLKIALWHSLLLLITYYGEATGLVPVASVAPAEFRRLAAFSVTAMWLFALVTATFSSLNERELRRRRADLEGLAGLAADLETVSSPEEVARVLGHHLNTTFGFRRAVVFGRRRSRWIVLARLPDGDVPQDPVGDGPLLKRCERERRSLLVRRLDERREPVLSELLPDGANVVVVPMIADALPIGTVALERGPEGGSKIARRVVTAIEQFAAHGALALRNAWLLERVQQLAETDPLTGVYNRRTFAHQLERHLSHSERTDEPLTLALFDLDRFKRFNDRYGHQIGDGILRDSAQALVTASRTFDTVARYGGEEFAVIMPGLQSGEALGAIE